MKFTLSIFLFSLLITSSCSEHIPTKNEQLFLDAADSLRMYQDIPYMKKQIVARETTHDLLTMEYEDFKEKHDWNNEEVEIFVDIIHGHINIAKMTEAYNLDDD